MIVRFISDFQAKLPVSAVMVFGAFFVCRVLSAQAPSGGDANKGTLRVEVQDAKGVQVAGPEVRTAAKETSSVLTFDRKYQPGRSYCLWRAAAHGSASGREYSQSVWSI